LGKENFEIKKGQKVAQVLIQRVETPKIEIVGELPKTNRGGGRVGSTGLY
jgi:dUTP pyrophosphatase